ncbi:MAG: AhpC/TSA family protein [Alistipes sp.]|uniref:TlpA disulfide reductase family protein n=1 Tax=Alistipes sp. TaxID=1872444 RepID=UPI0025BEDB86|nr:TlpA disulfide reductase family protein [Alistipes sp.]MCD8274849.1 AhpC/TSA family protein [Alistipes sp.]
MKKILLTASTAALLCGCGGPNYSITGNAGLEPGDSVFLIGSGRTELAAGVVSADSTIRLRGRVAEPEIAHLADQERIPIGTSVIFLEPGDIRMALTGDRRVYSASGTPLNDRKREFDERMADFDRKFRTLPFDASSDSLYTAYNKLLPESIENNLNNLFGAYLFAVHEFDGNDIAAAKSRLECFSPAMQAHPVLKRIAEKVAAAENTEIGKPYMDLMLPDAAGKPVKLSDIVGKGRWILLDFWATWCGPCCREIPHLREAYAACKSRGFEIYGVSLDNDDAKWKMFVKNNDMPWINVLGVGADKRSDAAVMYGISSIPANFLISPEGIIVARDLRGENIKARLEETIRQLAETNR